VVTFLELILNTVGMSGSSVPVLFKKQANFGMKKSLMQFLPAHHLNFYNSLLIHLTNSLDLFGGVSMYICIFSCSFDAKIVQILV